MFEPLQGLQERKWLLAAAAASRLYGTAAGHQALYWYRSACGNRTG
jgi:hypothetical protein